MNHLIQITKSDGTRQLFEEEKLVNSLKRVNASPEIIDEIVMRVEEEMHDGMPTSEIYRRAFELLKKHSAPVAINYSVRRALLDLGPDGFPFEKFIARIFKMWGYETLTDQTVMGSCVPHEIDIVAWKGDDLAMVEAKFHNGIGLSSDVKVTLYVKARFDDIEEVNFDYGGKVRKLTERWLVTNTKFTERAIHYAVCKNLKLVGWNYPANNSLHEIIEKNGLHPVTCITSLSRDQKKGLIDQNVLVCIDLISKSDVLKEVGVDPGQIPRIIEEAKMIVDSAK